MSTDIKKNPGTEEASKTGTSRREFLKTSIKGLATISIVPSFVLGGACTPPSDKIVMGFIGTGKQSYGLSSAFMRLDGVKMIAGCDVDSVKVQKFKEHVNAHYAEALEQPSYDDCKTYHEYSDLLARKDIDAVVVCTPDHWHALPSIAALKAGKDVYCEKPLSHTIIEGRAMVDATRNNGRVFQTGNMQRSWRDFRHACELVRNGYLGEITHIKVNVGGPSVPYDRPEEPLPASLDWDKWIGPAPYTHYNHVLAPAWPDDMWPLWRSYREFGGGGIADWGAHMFDIAQWALGMDHSGPVEFIPPTEPGANRGLIFKYENGVEVSHEDFGRGFAVRFIGTEGTLDVSREFLEPSNPALAEQVIGDNETKLYFSDNHYQDFVDAIKNRTEPVADVEIGHRTATVCNVANIAYELGRPLQWNPETEAFVNDDEANSKRGKEFRAPYVL